MGVSGENGQAGERALVSRLKRGDTAAFDEVYDRYRPRLFGFLARLTQQRELAEDLLQETWLRLAANATRLDDDTRLGAWLYTVARNLHRSHVRWVVVDLEHRRWLRRTASEGIENTSPFDLTSAGELERQLEHAVALLPLKVREAVLLVAMERLEPVEAARVLGITPEALRQRLSRGRARVAEHLERERDNIHNRGRTDAA
jgi:RNA polymerase sigma-70 factor (ECF subfamily)